MDFVLFLFSTNICKYKGLSRKETDSNEKGILFITELRNVVQFFASVKSWCICRGWC